MTDIIAMLRLPIKEPGEYVPQGIRSLPMNIMCHVKEGETVAQLVDRLLPTPLMDGSEFIGSIEIKRVKKVE